jgi:Fic family protein
MEYRGKQELYTKTRPETLNTLREKTIIQSVESSNRIEGITVERRKLAPLLNGEIKPLERPEMELLGYKRALKDIYSSAFSEKLGSRYILALHRMTCPESGHTGEYKKIYNEIIEFDKDGRKSIRFIPASAKETPELMDRLCNGYMKSQLPPLLKTATFVFDFLCIHPFLDGNGRLSRLLATYMLLKEGFTVSRYVSLERLVEERKEEYYAVLHSCSQNWHAAGNDIVPWWSFLLSIIKDGYREFDSRVYEQNAASPKTELIQREALSFVREFTVAEIAGKLPGTSIPLIKKTLGILKKGGSLAQSGYGRASRWRVI